MSTITFLALYVVGFTVGGPFLVTLGCFFAWLVAGRWET